MFTYRELKAIQEGNLRNADVMGLLREIKRLRALCVTSYDLMGRWTINDISADMRSNLDQHRTSLAAEPCVIEHELMTRKTTQLEIARKIAQQDREASIQRKKDASS